MSGLILIIQLIHCASQDSVLFLYGPKTPIKLKESYSNFTWVPIQSFLESYHESLVKPISLILDVSLDISLLIQIDIIASHFQTHYITLSKPIESESSFYRFYAFPSISSEVEVLKNMINYLSWDGFTVFLSNSVENIFKLDSLRMIFASNQVKSCIYDSNISNDELDSLVKRYLKITKDHNLLVLDEGPTLELLIKLLNKRKIGKYGKYFLIGPTKTEPLGLEGSVSLVYQDDITPKNEDEFYLKALNKIIQKYGTINKEGLHKSCPGKICFGKFQILNFQNNKTTTVGSIESSVIINKEIIYPGNNTARKSNFLKTYLPVMIANGTTETNDRAPNYINAHYYSGALLAVDKTNAELESEHLEYKLIPTDCGVTVFNLTWTVKCLLPLAFTNSIAYLTALSTSVCFSNLMAFKSFKRFLPQVSPFGYGDILENITAYPEFIKISGPYDDFFYNSYFIYLIFNWKKVILLVTDNSFFLSSYFRLMKMIQTVGMINLLPEKYNFLPENYTRDDFEKYRPVFQFIKDSGCRIIILYAINEGLIYEAFYDIGLRKGDIIIVGFSGAYLPLLEDIDEKYLQKRREITNGALLLFSETFEGEFGEIIKNELKQKYGDSNNMGSSFDAFKAISNTVEYMINKGNDYEDPQLFMKNLRNIKFTGCTGTVFFSKGQNTREKVTLNVIQIVIDQKTNEIDLLSMGIFNRIAPIPLKLINEPVWPTGETTVPSNFRLTQICVYKKNPQVSNNGKLSLLIFSLIFLLLVTITAFFSIKKFNYSMTTLSEKVHKSYADMLHQLFLISQLFQLLSLEPKDGLFYRSTNGANLKFGLDLIGAFDLKNADFWRFYILLLVFCALWTLLAVLSAVLKNGVLNNNKYLYVLKFLSESINVLISSICFIPLTLMLFSIYKCEEGVSDDLLDSFIYRDCTEFCYQGKHKQFLIISSLVIISFLIVSTYFRAYWELSQPGLHIKTKVSYSALLSVFQVILVLIRINLENTNKIFQGFLLFGIISLLAFITVWTKPFTFEKSNIFLVTILTVCSWNMILSSIYFLVLFEKELTIVLFLGIFVILAFGYKFSNQYPDIFISDNKSAVQILMKIQFSKKLDISIKENTFYKNIEKKILPEKKEID